MSCKQVVPSCTACVLYFWWGFKKKVELDFSSGTVSSCCRCGGRCGGRSGNCGRRTGRPCSFFSPVVFSVQSSDRKRRGVDVNWVTHPRRFEGAGLFVATDYARPLDWPLVPPESARMNAGKMWWNVIFFDNKPRKKPRRSCPNRGWNGGFCCCRAPSPPDPPNHPIPNPVLPASNWTALAKKGFPIG